MTSKLIDKLTKFCFHSVSPTTPASHTHNTSKPHLQPLSASPPTPLCLTPNPSPNGEGRDYRNRPVVRNNKAKFYRLYHQILFILYTQSLFVIMLFCLQKNHLSPFVIMSFCLQESPFLRLSLCYSVSKTSSVSICHYVTLPLKTLCHYMSLCHSVSKKNSVFTCPYVILSLKKHSAIICLYVILSLKKNSVFTCPYVILSLKKHSASIRPYVTLSPNTPLPPSVPMLFCLQNILAKTRTNV